MNKFAKIMRIFVVVDMTKWKGSSANIKELDEYFPWYLFWFGFDSKANIMGDIH